jgi:hypothetical protein
VPPLLTHPGFGVFHWNLNIKEEYVVHTAPPGLENKERKERESCFDGNVLYF